MSLLIIPALALDRIHADVTWYAATGVETGALLLASGPPDVADVLALCGDVGIERRPDQLVISGLALAVLFDRAEESALRVIAQVHSHGGAARMSLTDERFGLTVEGFVSAIVPHSRRPSKDPGQWGWWRFESGRWTSTAPGQMGSGRARIIVFDEMGVRDG